MRHARRGFALVIVLWVLAGLTVVAVAVASSLRTSAESVKLLRDRVRAEAAFLSTGARVLMLLSTARGSQITYESGHGTLFADGRPLQTGVTDEWVAVQDLRGLASLNRPAEQRLARLLQGCGADATNATRLVDALLDYLDSDSLKRLNGAEAFEYAGTDLPPPRNAALLSRAEVWRVKGWPELRKTWNGQHCDGLVTVQGDGLFNRNTASIQLLVADGMTPLAAAGLAQAREAGLTDLTLATQPGGEASNPFNFAGGGRVGPAVRLTQSAAWIEWAIEREFELSPSREGGPWRLHETRVVPRRTLDGPPTSSLPPSAFWDLERERALNNAATALPFGN